MATPFAGRVIPCTTCGTPSGDSSRVQETSLLAIAGGVCDLVIAVVATPANVADVTRNVIGSMARLAGAGIAIGLVAASMTVRLLQGLLFGVEATDPMTFVVAPAVIATTALLACLLPARRAARVNPLVALRSE